MPSIEVLKRYVSFDKGIFFPMADYYYGLMPWNQPIWREYRDFKMICFSKKMQEELKAHGFDTEYIQYFPQPGKISDWGDEHGVYFWQRVTHLNIYKVIEVLKGFPVSKLHLHKVPDPNEQFIPLPYSFRQFPITTSCWYESRKEMEQDMLKYAIYVAPRFVEGIGMGFLEAMANGRCVIANNDTTHNEYIEHGKTGILFDMHGAPPDLSGCDIRAIQKNAYKYICEGYKKWCREFSKLADLVLKPLSNDPALLKKNEATWNETATTVPFLQDPTKFMENSGGVPQAPPEPVGRFRRVLRDIKEAIKQTDGDYRTVKKSSFLHIPVFEKKVRSDGRRVLILFFSVYTNYFA